MFEFEVVVWWEDQFDATRDHIESFVFEATDEDDAARQFHEQHGDRHSIQCVIRK